MSLIVLALPGCSRNGLNQGSTKQEITMPDAPVIIYRTQGNFTDHVAVALDPSEQKIVAYPAPSDIRARLEAVRPTELNDGYLLDNQGIGIYSAFLGYTFKEYAVLKPAPSAEELWNDILVSDVITNMYRCRFRRNDPRLVEKLNQLIDEGRLDECDALR